MLTIISITAISSLVCFGFNFCYWYSPEWKEPNSMDKAPFGDMIPDKMNREILWFIKYYIGRFIWDRLPAFRFVLKPLFTCVVCMASVYSSIVYWCHFIYTGQPLTIWTFLIWPIIMVATCGLNRIIKTAIQI